MTSGIMGQKSIHYNLGTMEKLFVGLTGLCHIFILAAFEYCFLLVWTQQSSSIAQDTSTLLVEGHDNISAASTVKTSTSTLSYQIPWQRLHHCARAPAFTDTH